LQCCRGAQTWLAAGVTGADRFGSCVRHAASSEWCGLYYPNPPFNPYPHPSQLRINNGSLLVQRNASKATNLFRFPRAFVNERYGTVITEQMHLRFGWSRYEFVPWRTAALAEFLTSRLPCFRPPFSAAAGLTCCNERAR
jgi:hypothetical protein